MTPTGTFTSLNFATPTHQLRAGDHAASDSLAQLLASYSLDSCLLYVRFCTARPLSLLSRRQSSEALTLAASLEVYGLRAEPLSLEASVASPVCAEMPNSPSSDSAGLLSGMSTAARKSQAFSRALGSIAACMCPAFTIL